MSRYRILQLLRKPLVVVVAASSMWAQEAPIPAPTIRVSTHMVLLDVVVTDKQGKAVNGLHPEDFVVEENGKVQKISSLTTLAEKAASVPQLPAGVYSNK